MKTIVFCDEKKKLMEKRNCYISSESLVKKEPTSVGAWKRFQDVAYLSLLNSLHEMFPTAPKGIPIIEKKSYESAKKKFAFLACTIVQAELDAAKLCEVVSTTNAHLGCLKFEDSKARMAHVRNILESTIVKFETVLENRNAHMDKLNRKMISMKQKFDVQNDLKNKSKNEYTLSQARLAIECARLSPVLSDIRIHITRQTISMLEEIIDFDKIALEYRQMLVAKSVSRMSSKLAESRVEEVMLACYSEDILLKLELDIDDSKEIEAMNDITISDLKSELMKLADGEEEERRRIEDKIAAMEAKERADEALSSDIEAEFLIAKARLDCEIAESDLWAEWVSNAVEEGTPIPLQQSESSIRRKAAKLDSANKALRSQLIQSKQEVSDQKRDQQPAYCNESLPNINLAASPWIPNVAVSPAKLATSVSNLKEPALRVLALAEKRLQGQTVELVTPAKTDLSSALLRLEHISQKLFKFAQRFEPK